MATETFSTGLNMPAKTVVFTNVRKFDGGGFRWVSCCRRLLHKGCSVCCTSDAALAPSLALGNSRTTGSPAHSYCAYHSLAGAVGRVHPDERSVAVTPPTTHPRTVYALTKSIPLLPVQVRSGEYIQMSGRAGRRGLDDKGGWRLGWMLCFVQANSCGGGRQGCAAAGVDEYQSASLPFVLVGEDSSPCSPKGASSCLPPAPGIVILMMDTKLEPAVAKDMMKGAPDTLYSEFHLTYSMLLNLLK